MRVTARGAIGAVAIAMVAAVVGISLYIVGNPGEERVLRLDERRVQDMSFLRDAVLRYAERNKRLPRSLQDLTDLPGASRSDPATGQPYGYRTTGEATYELCADFERPTEDERARYADNTWKHTAGHVCFPQVAATLQQKR